MEKKLNNKEHGTESNLHQEVMSEHSQKIALLNLLERNYLLYPKSDGRKHLDSEMEDAKKHIDLLRDQISKKFRTSAKIFFPEGYNKTSRIIGNYIYCKMPDKEIFALDISLLGAVLQDFHYENGIVIRVKTYEKECADQNENLNDPI